jgi:hypothetical protein
MTPKKGTLVLKVNNFKGFLGAIEVTIRTKKRGKFARNVLVTGINQEITLPYGTYDVDGPKEITSPVTHMKYRLVRPDVAVIPSLSTAILNYLPVDAAHDIHDLIRY